MSEINPSNSLKGRDTVEPSAPWAHPLHITPPAQIAELVEAVGVQKTKMGVVETLCLGVLAGAFIALGALFYTMAITDSGLGLGPTRVLGGLTFSLGLILVIISGAELFTGNSLIVLAWADRKVSSSELLRNWTIVYIGNLFGALGTSVLVQLSGVLTVGDGAVAWTAADIALSKVALDPLQAIVRGVLCNVLVCLAVWMCFGAHSVSGKVLAIVFPVTAFVALGFEHSVANMYLIPIGAFQEGVDITVFEFLRNLLAVTAGNVVGGGVLVALVYWIIYRRGTSYASNS